MSVRASEPLHQLRRAALVREFHGFRAPPAFGTSCARISWSQPEPALVPPAMLRTLAPYLFLAATVLSLHACMRETRSEPLPTAPLAAESKNSADSKNAADSKSGVDSKSMAESKKPDAAKTKPSAPDAQKEVNLTMEIATFGNGCFWCTEAVFQQLEGVSKVVSGYAGGSVVNPTYRQVCGGDTGHAEALQITFDPKKIEYAKLLEVFWKTHDPTTLDRQGNDSGHQYRSVIFYHSPAQKELAEKAKAALTAAKAFDAPIVTAIEAYTNFYPAEDYHQNYFREHGSEGYCRAIIAPKVEKFRKAFKDLLKHE